VTTTQRI